MALRYIKQFSNFSGIASGATVTQNLPAFGTYYNIIITPLAGTTLLTDAQVAADIARIRVLAEGSELCNISGRDLIIYNNFRMGTNANGSAFAGDLIVPFVKPKWPTDQQQTLVGIGTQDINALTVEVTFGGGALTATVMQLRAEVDNTIAPLGQHLRLTTYPQNFAAAGVQELSTLPDEPNVAALAYFIAHSNASISMTDLTYFVNGSEIFRARRSNLIAKSYQNQNTNQAPAVGSTAAYTAIDFLCLDFNPSSDMATNYPLTAVQEQRLQLTWSAAPGAYNLIREAVFGVPVVTGQ